MTVVQEHDHAVVTTLADCDPAVVERRPGRRVHVVEPVRFGESPDIDIEHFRKLRELTGHTVRVRWRMLGRPLFALRTFVHLVPPDDGPLAGAWRAGYRYGSFYFRQGPDFVVVKDVRPDGEQARFTVKGEDAARFRVLIAAERLAELSPAGRDALDSAVEMELAVRGDEQLLLLPYRLRSWPVPYQAI
jgi:hypothetical protein